MSGQPQPPEDAGVRLAAALVRFDLAANPFAILGVTPRTPQMELHALAAEAATPAAADAARTLMLPRSRLGAEVSFLPGAADAAPAILAALAQGERPAVALLPRLAQANVLAHLCAAGRATAADRAALVASQPAPGDPSLAAAINGDRAVAGVPAIQPAALRAEQDGLASLHAAALVGSCQADPSAAAEIASLVRAAPPGPSTTVARRAAAAWARGTATALAALEEATADLQVKMRRRREPDLVDQVCQAAQSWAALDAPQRAADACAGLDHEPALRVLRPLRAAAADLAREGYPNLAHHLASSLAQTFADLPGEAAILRDEARAFAGQLEDMALQRQLLPLRALADRLSNAPEPLEAELAKRPFGPGARGVAGELWTLFDAACQLSEASDAPWTILRALASCIGGPERRAGASDASVLLSGMIQRAGAAGRTALMTRLAAEQRGFVAAALLHDYQFKAAAFKGKSFKYFHQRALLAAIRRLLPVVNDPDDRSALLRQERLLVRNRRLRWWVVVTIAVLGLLRTVVADHDYARTAPYRQPPRTPYAPPAQAYNPAPAPLPVPFPAEPSGQGSGVADGPGLPKTPLPLPPSSKFPDEPATPAAVPRPVLPRHEPREVQPAPTGGPLTRAEATWCVFNDIRLRAAETAASPRQLPGVLALRASWQSLCQGSRPMPPRLDSDLQLEAGHARGLVSEGRALLRQVP